MDGICTLANDRVYDQVVALLNSIEAIAGKDMPVCIYPYDDNTARLSLEVSKRPNVQLYDNRESIDRWDDFARAAWDSHPTASQIWQKAGSHRLLRRTTTEPAVTAGQSYHRFGTHRRYCAFEAPFDRFLYMDADTLLMSPVDKFFNLLESNDCVVYDFQHKDPTHVYTIESPQLATVFSPQRVAKEIFCSGFYASKKELFPEVKRKEIINHLQSGEAEILYPMAPDQTLINYMMMRSAYSIYNLAFNLPKSELTGCCVTSSHFQTQDYILYDKGQRLTYIHYIGLSSRLFARVCEGENIDFPYRDIFLYYRYLHEPEKYPQFIATAKPYNQPPSLVKRVMSKLRLK